MQTTRTRYATLALGLAGVTCLVHYAPGLAAQLYPQPLDAERAWEYVAQGLKGIALLAIIIALLPRTRWAVPVWAAAAWGIWEDALVAGCRLAIGIGQPPAAPGNTWQGICAQSTQAPLWVGAAVLAVLTAACIWHVLEEREDPQRPAP